MKCRFLENKVEFISKVQCFIAKLKLCTNHSTQIQIQKSGWFTEISNLTLETIELCYQYGVGKLDTSWVHFQTAE